MLEISQALLCLQREERLYPLDMSFKDRFKKSRKAVPKLTQAVIAKALGVTPQAVSGWERGAAMPEPDKLPALSALLKVEIAFLLGGPPKSIKN
jgi:transcriptional regulator with XRE-family HTH domain